MIDEVRLCLEMVLIVLMCDWVLVMLVLNVLKLYDSNGFYDGVVIQMLHCLFDLIGLVFRIMLILLGLLFGLWISLLVVVELWYIDYNFILSNYDMIVVV